MNAKLILLTANLIIREVERDSIRRRQGLTYLPLWSRSLLEHRNLDASIRIAETRGDANEGRVNRKSKERAKICEDVTYKSNHGYQRRQR